MKERFLGVSVRKANPDTDSRVVPAPAHEHFLTSHQPANPAPSSSSSRVQYMSDDELEVCMLDQLELIGEYLILLVGLTSEPFDAKTRNQSHS